MTAFRLISLPAHGTVELVCGLATMVVPAALGFSAAGLIIGVVLGALIIGMALSTAPGDRGGLSVAAHFALDRGIVIGLLGVAIVLAATADSAAALFFAVIALVQLGLNVTTRYTATA